MIQEQRLCRLDFVPYVARLLLSGRQLRKNEKTLAFNEQHLTIESVHAIQEMINKSVLRYILDEFGWRKVISFTKQTLKRETRLLDCADLEFKYSHHSLETLITCFNQKKHADISYSCNGDLWLDYILLRSQNSLLKSRREINLLCRIDDMRRDISLSDLEFFSIHDMIPWVSVHWSTKWITTLDKTITSDPDIIEHLEDKIHFLNTFLNHRSQTSNDIYLYPLFNFFSKLSRQLKRFEAKLLNRIEKVSRISERQKILRVWQKVYEVAFALEGIYQQYYSTHPIDREDHQTFVMTLYDSYAFGDCIKRLMDSRDKLEKLGASS